MNKTKPTLLETLATPSQTSNWTPLINLVGRNQAQAFMFVGNAGEIMVYKHCTTRRYLNIHILSGQTCRYEAEHGYVPISPEAAIASATGHGATRRDSPFLTTCIGPQDDKHEEK